MNRVGWAGTMLAAALFVLSSVPARAQEYEAKLSGFQELGALNSETGAILSAGEGTLKLTLDKSVPSVTYTLTYSFPDGTRVLQSHIHFGKEHVPGSVMVFFCANPSTVAPIVNLPPSPAIAPPACPTPAGTVTSTITPRDVVAVASQNITAGDFSALVAALASDTAYVNVHTAMFTAGEIRGQIRLVRRHRGPRGKGDDHNKDKDKDEGR